jgi:hypothetical protein
LDEPTAVLTPQEADDLFRIMRELTQRGVSIIFISHKLKEVLAIADRITVLRGGRVVGETTPQQSDEHSLAAMMVGREVLLTVEKEDAQPKQTVLQVKACASKDKREHEAVAGVAVEVHAGEVLGIAVRQRADRTGGGADRPESFLRRQNDSGWHDVTNATPAPSGRCRHRARPGRSSSIRHDRGLSDRRQYDLEHVSSGALRPPPHDEQQGDRRARQAAGDAV